MKNSRMFIFSLIVFCSCHAIGNNKVDSYHLVETTPKVVLDETDLVHTVMPQSLHLISDTSFGCISDNRVFAAYNIATGKLIKQIDIAELLDTPIVYQKMDSFIFNEIDPYYPKRKYGKTISEEIIIPSFRVDGILSIRQVEGNTIADVLVSIAFLYKKELMIDGQMQEVNVNDYAPIVVSISMLDQAILSIAPVKVHLLTDRSEEHPLYTNTQFGGILTKNNTLILPLISDLNNYSLSDELIAFDLNNPRAQPYSFNQQYPADMGENPMKWLTRKYFHYDDEDRLYYNSLFTIYEIVGDAVQPVVPVDTFLNKSNFERVKLFTKVDDNLFLLEICGIDINKIEGEEYRWYSKFVFCSPQQNTMSASVRDFLPKDESWLFPSGGKKLISLSRDSAYFYVQQFEIKHN